MASRQAGEGEGALSGADGEAFGRRAALRLRWTVRPIGRGAKSAPRALASAPCGGALRVSDVVAPGPRSGDEVLALAASPESRSEHPIAKGFVEGARRQGARIAALEDLKAVPGRGAEGLVEGTAVKVMSPAWLRERGMMPALERAAPLIAQRKTVVFVLVDGEPVGAIGLADIVRAESRTALRQLCDNSRPWASGR